MNKSRYLLREIASGDTTSCRSCHSFQTPADAKDCMLSKLRNAWIAAGKSAEEFDLAMAGNPDTLSLQNNIAGFDRSSAWCYAGRFFFFWSIHRLDDGQADTSSNLFASLSEGYHMHQMRVQTALGTLVAYPSIDPSNPGIFIDLENPNDADFSISLSCTECQQDKGRQPTIVTHVWGDADQEDSTSVIEHQNI